MPPHSLYTRIPQRFSLPSVLVSLRPSAYSVSSPLKLTPYLTQNIILYIRYIINIAGNLITLLALLKSPTIREHATTAFVISLSISDLLFCSFSLPLTAVRFFQEVRMGAIATLILVLTYTYPFLSLSSPQSWTFGSTLCKIFPVIFYGNVAVSLLSMVGITLNR